MNGVSLVRPTYRRESSDEKNKSSKPILNQTTVPSESKRTIGSLFGPVSARDIENEKPPATSTFTSLIGGGGGTKQSQSIFEKVDTHGGGTTYLGSGTSSQIEDCIRNCLSKSHHHADYIHCSSKYDFPYKSLTRASVLDDYSYDGIISSRYHHHTHHGDLDDYYYRHCTPHSNSKSYHYLSHSDSDCHHHHHHSYSHGCDSDYHHYRPRGHKVSAADLSLDEIRQVNDSLGKCGIPVFSQHNDHYNYNKPRPVGDIVSACQQILADPTLRHQREGQHAVQHVWDNLHYHSPQTNMYGYASPAVRGVASHLFNPGNQPPYSPVNSVAHNLFGSPAPYNPAPGNLFGNPPAPYNPPPPPNPYNPPPPNPYNPPPATSSAGQSVISRLFGGGH